MTTQQTILTILGIIVFLAIFFQLTGFTSGKNKLKKVLPFKQAKQIDYEKVRQKIVEDALANPSLDTNTWEVFIERLERYGRSKYQGEMHYLGKKGGIYVLSASGRRVYKY